MPSIAYWPGVGGGTAHYRCWTPGKALERRGWDVSYLFDETSVVDADIVVFQRTLGDDCAHIIRELKKRTGAVTVFDIDDWFDGIPDYNPAKSVETDPNGNLGHLHDAMRAVDLITVSTPELAEGYGRINRTVILPNYLDPDLWTGNEHFRQPRKKIHVGWMGALGWRTGDVDLLKPWLPDWLHDHPDVEFVAVGCGELPDYLGIRALVSPKLHPHSDNWLRPYEHLPALLPWLDIGLVPLVHNRFNQAKSWCKGMEYNACGVPAVASPSREYRKFIEPGVNGYLVRHEEWGHTLDKAITNLPQLQAGAAKTAERYFIDQHIDLWIDAYEGVKRGTRRLVHL